MSAPTARPYSEACERNWRPILEVLREVLPAGGGVLLEVGSGTGQHAAYIAPHLPGWTWQPSDRPENLPGIRAWRDEAIEAAGAGAEAHIAPPLELDLLAPEPWPIEAADALFCANTIHIAPAEATERLFALGAAVLPPGAPLVLYGPFRYRDRELEPSNARVDDWLRVRDPRSGLRLFEEVDARAAEHGFAHLDERLLPANNRVHLWRRRP